MKFKTYLWRCLTWFTAGSLLGTYLPGTALANALRKQVIIFLTNYPAYLRIPALVFLLLIFAQPAANLIRRYWENWRAPAYVFTPVEAVVSFLSGIMFAGLLNGSIPHHLSEYPRGVLQFVTLWVVVTATVISGVLIASLKQKGSDSKISPRDPLIDVPITQDSEDLLDRTKFVDDYYAQIKRFVYRDSFVFGLNGAWGTGKTSALNLLRNRLRSDPEIILVDFNPWHFQSAETLIRNFYEMIGHAVNEIFYYPSLSAAVRRYAKLLAPTLKRVGMELDWGQDPNIDEVKEQVQRHLANSGRRLVIIIDDLERASGEELRAVFQIVRLSGNFKNTLFILAYDQEQIEVQLGRMGTAPAFFEKIIQSPQELPAADRNEIDRFVLYSNPGGPLSGTDQLLDRLGIIGERRDSFDKAISEIYVSRLYKFFPNLRSAKRFLTAFSVRLPAIKDEVNLHDFFLLEILRIFAHAVYQDIIDNSYYYLPAWTNKVILASPFGLDYDEASKKNSREKIRSHIEGLLENEPLRDDVIAILSVLFPARIADSFGHPKNYDDSFAVDARAKQKITHPECFEKYFLLDVARGNLPDVAVERLFGEWLALKDPKSRMLEELGKLRNAGELDVTLNRMVIFLGRLDPRLAYPFLEALAIDIRAITPQEDRSEQDAEFKLALFLIDEKIEVGEKGNAIYTFLRDVRALEVAVRLVGTIQHGKTTVAWSLRKYIDLPKAREIVANRFKKEFVDTGADIMATPCQSGYILFQIGTYDAEMRKVVNDYAFALMEEHPSYIGRIVDGFFLDFGGVGADGFNSEDLKRVYDVPRLAQLARREGQHAVSSSRERKAMEEFLKMPGTNPVE